MEWVILDMRLLKDLNHSAVSSLLLIKIQKNRIKFKKLGGKYVGSIGNLISKIDALTLHCNLNSLSHNVLGNKKFNKIKNEALIKALKKKKVS